MVDSAEFGAGIDGNESTLRIVRSAVGLGNDGRAALSDLTVTTIAFDQGAGRVAITRGLERDELPAPVRAMRIRYLAEDGWQDAFASDEAGAFPVGIEVSVWFDRGGSADFADPADSAATRPDRRRFFRCMGGPKVDPLAIRSIESEVTR